MVGLGLMQLLNDPLESIYSLILGAAWLATCPLSAVLKMVKLIDSGSCPGEAELQSRYNFKERRYDNLPGWFWLGPRH